MFVSTRRPPRLKREEVASSRAVQSLQGNDVAAQASVDAEQTAIMNARDIAAANVSGEVKSENKSEKSGSKSENKEAKDKETKESKISNTGKIARIDTGQIKAVKK